MGPDLLQRHRSLRVLVGLVIVVISFYLIGIVWNVLADFGYVILLFFLAWVITFILEPVCTFLQSRGFSRLLAVSLIFTALLIVITGVIVLGVFAIKSQVTAIATEIQTTLAPGRLDSLQQQATNLLEHFGVSQAQSENLVSQAVKQIPGRAGTLSTSAVNTATGLLSSLFAILFDASLVLILAFYMMLDGGRLFESLVAKMPPVFVPDIRLFQRHVEEIFGGFFRAEIIIAAVYGVFTWLILLPLGQADGGIIAAVLSGIIMILPFIGPFISIVPPAVLVVLGSPPDQLGVRLVILIVALAAAQHVVLNLLAPKILGTHVGVDPIILFGVLLIGAKEGGVWGAFFAGPVAGVMYAMIETFYDRFAATSPLFKREPRTEPDALGSEPPSFRQRLLGTLGLGEQRAPEGQPAPADSPADGESDTPPDEREQRPLHETGASKR